MIDKIGHVTTEINSISGKLDPKAKANGIFIRCPYHSGGNENTGSCRVNLHDYSVPVGTFYCFGCKAKGGWNKLAEQLGLRGFKASDQVHDIYNFSFIDAEDKRRYKLEDYESLQYWPKNKIWRKIKPETIRTFEGRVPEHDWYYRDFLYFPVLVNKKYVGGVYARKIVTKEGKANGEISYINTPGKWTKTNLFGYDVAKKQKGGLWLEEGPRDVMKTNQVGGRAVGLFGAYLSKRKVELIQALDPPFIVAATDPDQAGEGVREVIKDLLKDFPIYDANFPKGKDPGCFTPKSYHFMCKNIGIKG